MHKLLTFIKAFFSLSLLLIIFGFTSCTQELPEIRYANLTVIFEYNKLDALPSSRLSVFVESISDVRRYESINVKNKENGFIWEVSELIRIRNAEKMYAGNTNLMPPSDEIIPTGNYEIVYSNADNEKTETNYKLEYDTLFYETPGSQIPDLMKTKRAKKYISIYDKNDKLLFYGERNEQLSDNRKIWNRYSSAAYFHDVWILPDKSVICLMPKELVTPSA